ncbi:MAG: hypothetical protein WKF75_04755 [Singulisphaera sp.]
MQAQACSFPRLSSSVRIVNPPSRPAASRTDRPGRTRAQTASSRPTSVNRARLTVGIVQTM